MNYESEYMNKFHHSQQKLNDTCSDIHTNKKTYLEEPTLQRKKRVQINYQPLKLTDGSTLNEEQIKIKNNLELKTSNNKPIIFKSSIKNDEFVLLGPQDKFSSSSNIPYRLRILNKDNLETKNSNEEKKIQENMSLKNQDKNNDDNFHLNDELNIKSKIKKSDVQKKNKTSPLNHKIKTLKIPKDIKPAPQVKVDSGAIKETKTNFSNENNILRNTPMSEYQKSFIWSKSVPDFSTILKASIKHNEKSKIIISKEDRENEPIAEETEIKKKTNDEKKIPTNKVSGLRNFVTEYKSNFTNSFPKKIHNVSKEMIDRPKSADDSNLILNNTSNPQKPFGPHGKIRRWKSEYQNSFKPFCMNISHLVADDEKDNKPEISEWFKNILELRQKANEYKIRTRGVNFSSSHMAQLESKNVNLWDIESNESHPNDSKQSKIQNYNVKENKIERCSSAEPRITENELEKKNSKNKKEIFEVKSDSKMSIQEAYIEDDRKNSVVIPKNIHVYRLIENLSSNQVKNNMVWDDSELYENEKAFENQSCTKNSSELISQHLNLLNKAKQQKLDQTEYEVNKLNFNKSIPDQRQSAPKTSNLPRKIANDSSVDKIHYLKTINENFSHTYTKNRIEDMDSLSQLSTRSLASSSSLLDRAKENHDKFWGSQKNL